MLECFPLEFHRLSVNSIQTYFVLPDFNWLVSDTSQTEHRVGEDIGFGIRNLNRFVT